MTRTWAFIICLWIGSVSMACQGQAPGVPVYEEGGKGARTQNALAVQVTALRTKGLLLDHAKLKSQMERTSCELALPEPVKTKLESRELWRRARNAHLRLGWSYQCNKCEQTHLELSGAYAITKEVIATCAHVVQPPADLKEGWMVAVDESDRVLAVTEMLAYDFATDCAILRLADASLEPLPLSTDVTPGDLAACFSDPLDRRGYFSTGYVNRFVRRPFLRKRERLGTTEIVKAVFMQVSTDWAPGSSGSAVLDACGNIIGHVSEIQTMLEEPLKRRRTEKAESQGTQIVFHDAIAAANLLKLIRKR